MMNHEPATTCRSERRRYKIREQKAHWNGLDYLEVLDGTTLRVYFLNKAPAEDLEPWHVVIRGGRRVCDIQVVDVTMCRRMDPALDDCMVVRLDKTGDLSTYTLCVVRSHKARREDEPFPGSDPRSTDEPYPGFDSRYACLGFSFQVLCPSDLDCAQAASCPPEIHAQPEINYLAKDYTSFRQLILDRLALIMPGWQERHVPDLGIALVELLAYAGDHLSYYQDAVATEAYLDTARQRISVRRHARLVDYQMHEGNNARAWVHVQAEGGDGQEIDPANIFFITGHNDVLPVSGRLLTSEDIRPIPRSQYEVFQPLDLPAKIPRFSLADLKDAGCLAARLKDDPGPASRFLAGRLGKRTRELLAGYDGVGQPAEALQQALVAELNRLLEDDGLSKAKPFSRTSLSLETQALRAANPRGQDLLRVNRALLETSFAQDLARLHWPGEPLRFYTAHNEIRIYTWGDRECCLPRGATAATLWDDWDPLPGEDPTQQKQQGKQQGKQQAPEKPLGNGRCFGMRKLRNLQPGDVLIFEEIVGPETGAEADADPTHRHPVRLTAVKFEVDELYDQPVVEIAWDPADALPFPLCISALDPDCQLIDPVSVARGNIVLVDHGRPAPEEDLGCVPFRELPGDCLEEGWLLPPTRAPERFRLVLSETPITFSQPLMPGMPAVQALSQDPRQALPQIQIASAYDLECDESQPKPLLPEGEAEEVLPRDGDEAMTGEANQAAQHIQGIQEKVLQQTPIALVIDAEAPIFWLPQRDLLSSGPLGRHFVAEIDNEGRAHLRFGDGDLGRQPRPGSRFSAHYRVGNGLAGNVGAEAISHLVTVPGYTLSGVDLEPRNPLPARGGADPEPMADAKLFAPYAFRRRLERAVTAEDYAQIVMRDFPNQVQRAAATLRWTGSWHEVLVAVDPKGKAEAEPALLEAIEHHLHRFRRVGHDLAVRPAEMAPLDLAMAVCVLPHFLRGHVKAALLARLSNRRLPDGQVGFFHPDSLTFGEGVLLSRLVAAAQAVPGVESVRVTRLERLGEGPNGEIEAGVLPLGPLEIARLDNDPSLPENGRLELAMGGGR